MSILCCCRLTGGFLMLMLAVAATVGTIHTADAARQPADWRKRGWSDEFNGSFTAKHWVKSTQSDFGDPPPGGTGRNVAYYTWMVGFQEVGTRHCLKIRSHTYGTVDKGGALDNTSGSGGHELKYGWFEATTKVSALDASVWSTWWTHTPFVQRVRDELDIMEYAFGNLGVKHWRQNLDLPATDPNHKVKYLSRDWYSGNAYIKSNVVDKFSLWSVKSTANGGTVFYKDTGWLKSGSTKVIYPMFLRLSSSPNRMRAETPKDKHLANFFVDYVRIWTPN